MNKTSKSENAFDLLFHHDEQKLFEEMLEYHQDKSVEELADIVEVIYAIVKSRGLSVEEFEKIRRSKADERGGFDKKILLKSVTYEEE